MTDANQISHGKEEGAVSARHSQAEIFNPALTETQAHPPSYSLNSMTFLSGSRTKIACIFL